MSGFVLGICFAGGMYAGNKVTQEIMNKIHQYNPDELCRLKIPGYPIYSYIKFKLKQNKENKSEIEDIKKSGD